MVSNGFTWGVRMWPMNLLRRVWLGREMRTRMNVLDAALVVCARVLMLLVVRKALSEQVHPGITGVAAGTPQHTTATVFQDTALFRELCTQADSGLAPSVGRCTLRDQRREIVRPDS